MPAVLLQGDVFVSSPLTSLAEPCASAILAAQPCEAHPSPVVLYYHPRPFLEPWKDFSSSRRVTSLVAPGPDQPALFDHRWVSVCSCAHRHGLDEADSRSCAGCSLPMDRVGDHALCWAKLGIYVRHNDPETNSQRFASRWVWRWNSINARTIGDPWTCWCTASKIPHWLSIFLWCIVCNHLPVWRRCVWAGKLALQTENCKPPACLRRGWSFCPSVIEPVAFGMAKLET